MKGKKPLERPQSYKLLEGESEKLKDKLEGLRQQIKAKKHEKELSKTMHSMGYPSIKVNSNSTAATIDRDYQLFKLALTDMKIELVQQKLKQKGITNLERLTACSELDVDQWKDIPVGYRIKLKKYIQKQRQKSTSAFNLTSNDYRQGESIQKAQMDIQQIIKNRKAEQKFVPLIRKNEQEEDEPQLKEQDQQIMMLSILEVISLKQRTSCLSKVEKTIKKGDRKVHWSASVEEMEKHHKMSDYPKESISKSLFHIQPIQKQAQVENKQSRSFDVLDVEKPPDYKYCWSCLKRIKNEHKAINQRYFCSQSCQFNYQMTINPVELLQKIVQTEDKYNIYINYEKSKPKEEQIDLLFQ